MADIALVMFALALVGALAAVAVAVNWGMTRVDAIGRTTMFPFVRFTLFAALAVAAGIPAFQALELQRQLSATAVQLSGRDDVRVSCKSLKDEWVNAHQERGYVQFDGSGKPDKVAHLSRDTCTDLREWIGAAHENPTLEQIIAVHVLTHEAMHLSGIRDEAKTECAAMQRNQVTATSLGATPEQAHALAQDYLTKVYPTVPSNYSSTQCHLGGSLDEQLDSSPWR